ncbi:MAG: hypothetical protein K2X11_17310 [Acetobacteraceae bacterium]|nr:hypothetical protein [Acetobacteraceae bacterium]
MSYDSYAAARSRVLTSASRRIPAASAASQARALGLWHKGQVRVANDAQFGLVLDLGVFAPVGGHSAALEREAKAGEHTVEEAKVLDALQAARFALFRVEGAHPDGGVLARDLLRGQDIRLEDRNLAKPEMLHRGFAGRLMTLDGYAMTCGALAGLSDVVIEELLGRAAPVEPSPPELPMLSPLMEEDVLALRSAALAEDFVARVYRASLRHGMMGNLPA